MASSSSFENEARRAIPCEVHMISGSMDSQTSSDVFNVGSFQLPDPAGKAGGACTSSLLKVLHDSQQEPLTWVSLLQNMRTVLREQDFDQIPQLTSSRMVNVEKPFHIVPPDCKGTRRAVLIGINYKGQQGELRGCHNDVLNLKRYLEQEQGFRDFDILMDDGMHTSPTKANILKALETVTRQSKSGDVVFVHYSGHGGRLLDQDAKASLSGQSRMLGGDEEDGYDETLIPLDFSTNGQIRDDDLLRVLVEPMNKGVHMTCLMDSCHSGTVLDLPYKYTCNSSKMDRNEKYNQHKFLRSSSVWGNVLNFVAYLANAAVAFGIGVFGLFGFPTNAEISTKYQTLVTPISWSFAIWGVIFLSQFIWAIAQLFFRKYRGMVQRSVKWYYLRVCTFQIAWTLVFSMEIIWLSLVLIVCTLGCLLCIVVSQYHNDGGYNYWLFKFPFSIHFGWILAATLVNVNVLFVSLDVGSDGQYYAALATLLAILLIAAFALAFPLRPDLTIPLVLAWATLGINAELENPSQQIVATFDSFRISIVRNASFVVYAFIIVATVIVAVVLCYRQRKQRQQALSNNKVDEDDDETGVYQEMAEI